MINYLIGGVILILVLWAVVSVFRKSKNKSGLCGCSCSDCASSCSNNNDQNGNDKS